MGWYHAKQILEGRVARTTLAGIVEPFLLGPGRDTGDAAELRQWLHSHASSVPLFDSVRSLGMTPPEHSYALIASRTQDMPRLFQELVDQGFRNIYLEKPGADSLADLEAMAELSRQKGVRVAVGYNKNVARYVTEARSRAADLPGSEITFIHMNPYEEAALDECFERNSEGMLKNMMIHEIALMCTYWSIRAQDVAEVILHDDQTVLETRRGPSGRHYTDFSKLGFTLVTHSGSKVSARADRCGGNFSAAEVALDGNIELTSVTPDAKLEEEMRELESKSPGCQGYFYLQDGDYITLKERFAAHIADGSPGLPVGLASIEVGVEALKVAELLEEKCRSGAVSE